MYLIQTVQTSWRPQLPLPKEVDISPDNEKPTTPKETTRNDIDELAMERLHQTSTPHRHQQQQQQPPQPHSVSKKDNSLNTAQNATNKKWSFGRLFRKKKDIETDSSSEEDRKAGFVPASKYHSKSTSKTTLTAAAPSSSSSATKANRSHRSSKLIGAGFDHIVLNPMQSQQQHNQQQQHHNQHQQHQHHQHHHPTHHMDNEFFLPVETIKPQSQNHQEPYYQNEHGPRQYLAQPQFTRSSNSLDRRSGGVGGSRPQLGHKSRSAQRLPQTVGVPVIGASSEEELISLNSSTFSKYRSDESIHSGGVALAGCPNNPQNPQNPNNAGQSRRSRAARNERYYKRLSRDGELSHGQVPVMYAPQPVQRWKTQPVPLSVYNGPSAAAASSGRAHQSQPIAGVGPQQRLRNTTSLQHMGPYVQWGQMQQQQQQHQQQQQQQHQAQIHQPQYHQSKGLQNTVNDTKRSISYDSHIHLQNVNGRMQTKPLPPPPPPRDPLRRVNVGDHLQNGSSGDLRPLSYAFDPNGVPVLPSARLNSRCVSDDKIWAGHGGANHYQSAHSLNVQAPQQTSAASTPQPTTAHGRRFITRAERDAHPSKKSLPNGLDFHYVADATPRSRKPIHMLEPQAASEREQPTVTESTQEPASTSVLRTTKSGLPSPSAATKQAASDFWKRLDEGSQRRGRQHTSADPLTKPRSVSSSRAGELRSYAIPLYSEVYKPNRPAKPQAEPQPCRPAATDEVDNVVCGSLHIKPTGQDKSSNYVEIRHKDTANNKSSSMPNHYQRRSGELPNTPNKYEEYVAEKLEQHHKPSFNPPTPPQRKLSVPPNGGAPIYFPRKKPANLEEAINELEAIYKSLGLSEEASEKALKDDKAAQPSDFERYALAHADEYDDEDSPTGEPDPVLDDVAYRNIQLANLQHKTSDKQPPFGIPIGPIVPSPHTDYLHVTPVECKPKLACNAPDVVKDDLAVRTLRKDPPGPKEKFLYPNGSLQKKHRATRTQSANIYSLIQRDAAKPSGGDLYSFMELTKSIDRAGSMSDLSKGNYTHDIPSTLTLLRNLKEQEQEQQQQLELAVLPKKHVHVPFRHPSQLGAIAQLPEILSATHHDEPPHKPTAPMPVPLPRKSLTPEPTVANHQMEDALNQIAKDAQESSVKLTKELQELRKEALITAAAARQMPAAAATTTTEEQKLEKDLLEIEAVSEAAKRCGKMLLDTLPDAGDSAALSQQRQVVAPRKLHKEGKQLIKAIDEVSEAANAVCEKILKDIVTTEPPVVVQEAVQVCNRVLKEPAEQPLVMPNLIKKLDPVQSDAIAVIAKRCMRQLSELAVADDSMPDYDNLVHEERAKAAATTTTTAVACNRANDESAPHLNCHTHICTVAEKQGLLQPNEAIEPIEEIDKIMQECEAQVRTQQSGASTNSTISTTTTTTTTKESNSTTDGGGNALPNSSATTVSSFSSSSDCLAKSSSPSSASRRRQSSSITSFNPYSSSDYLKSPSSEYHAPSTDPIKTFSTTSYDVPSTSSATPNITTNSTFSCTPSPPLNLTPVSGRRRVSAATAAAAAAAAAAAGQHLNDGVDGRVAPSNHDDHSDGHQSTTSSPSQYNSSEELAMIFGIEERPRGRKNQAPPPPPPQLEQQQHQRKQSIVQAASQEANISGNIEAMKNATNHHTPATNTTNSNIISSSHTKSIMSLSLLLLSSSSKNASASYYRSTANHTPQPTPPPPPPTNHSPSEMSSFVNVVVVDADDYAADVNNDVNAVATTTTTNNATNNCPSSTNATTTNSYKLLATIPELLNEHDNQHQPYATSELSMLDDSTRINDDDDPLQVDKHIDVGPEDVEDEVSSNPDSGNASLADYPLCGAGTGAGGGSNCNNASSSVQLQSNYNSRYEIRKSSYISEVCILKAIPSQEEQEHDFPPPPTEEELLESLKEKTKKEESNCHTAFGIGEDGTIIEPETVEAAESLLLENFNVNLNSTMTNSLEKSESPIDDLERDPLHEMVRKRSVVYETPQLTMSISEVKEVAVAPPELEAAQQLSSQELQQRLSDEAHVETPQLRHRPQLTTMPEDRADDGGDDFAATPSTSSQQPTSAASVVAVAHRRYDNDSDDDDDAAACQSLLRMPPPMTVSLFGELRAANRLTTLEHVLMACTLGVITPNDLFTLCLIVIAVITIVAMILL